MSEVVTKKIPSVKPKTELLALGRQIVLEEIQALHGLVQQLDEQFEKTCECILGCRGRVVVTGMGKSGHIAGKIAATLASTGTPAFFMHPGEAGHGDLGMITPHDVVLAISYSGETQELITLLPLVNRLGAQLISITGRPHSTLAKRAHINLKASIPREACPLGLAPTSSTTVSLVLGDAIAITLLQMRGLTAEQFALSHPCGSLGHQLRHVVDVMHRDEAMPLVRSDCSLSQALLEVSRKRFGMTMVMDPQDRDVVGIFTDGDLRRTLDTGVDIHSTLVRQVMTTNFVSIHPGAMAAEALQLMNSRRISALPVMDLERQLLGIVHLHDLILSNP